MGKLVVDIAMKQGKWESDFSLPEMNCERQLNLGVEMYDYKGETEDWVTESVKRGKWYFTRVEWGCEGFYP